MTDIPIGLENMSLKKLREMWENADSTGEVEGYAQGAIAAEIKRRSNPLVEHMRQEAGSVATTIGLQPTGRGKIAPLVLPGEAGFRWEEASVRSKRR